tara:strand:- start:158 stop:262 length:105 start_codon:yes stop_codon:yes gene_type:complete
VVEVVIQVEEVVETVVILLLKKVTMMEIVLVINH